MKKKSQETVGAVIVAAGSSQRMGGTDKMFAPLGGKPLLAQVIDVFQKCDSVDQIVVVLGQPNLEQGRQLAAKYNWSKVSPDEIGICLGGERRQDSVRNGLNHLRHCDWVVIHDGALPLSASAVKLNGDFIHTPFGKKEYETPRSMTLEEIKATIKDYQRAAGNAKEAGFSGVELHGANGYLINQFLDAKTNRRTDEYGGSLENRYRFLKEVLAAILEIWPSHRVGIRLSPNGVFNDMGSPDFRQIYLYAIRELNKLSLGYVHIMDGLAFGFHNHGEPITLSEFRKEYDGIIMGNCGYSQEEAEQRLARGYADLAAFGRPFISNPDLPARLQNGWPLNPFDNMTHWYTPGPVGYTDYAPYRP